MEPLTAIALAKKIADVTGVSHWLKDKVGEAFGEKTASKIIDVASIATSTSTPEGIIERLKADEALRGQVKENILKRQHELKLAYLEDRQNARKMYVETDHELADEVARRVISWNHWVVLLLIVANGLVINFVDDKTVVLALGNLIGVSINALWQERQQVIGFLFGSSLGSKAKDKLIPQSGR